MRLPMMKRHRRGGGELESRGGGEPPGHLTPNDGGEFLSPLYRLHEEWLRWMMMNLGCDDRASTRRGCGAAEEQEDPHPRERRQQGQQWGDAQYREVAVDANQEGRWGRSGGARYSKVAVATDQRQRTEAAPPPSTAGRVRWRDAEGVERKKRTKTTENVCPQGLVLPNLAPGKKECNDDGESVVLDQADDQGWNNNNHQVCDHHRGYDQEEDDREKSIDLPLPELDTGSKIPPYDPSCCGGPWEWNRKEAQSSWSRKAFREFDQRRSGPRRVAEPNINTVLVFLHQRCVLHKLCRPVFHGKGWYRLHWKSLSGKDAQKLECDGWLKAWHGTKIEALYSILFQERLAESSDADEDSGERMLGGVPGVYCHKGCLRAKTEFYMRFMPLFGDDVFWAAQFELLVDPKRQKRLKKDTDQWAFTSDAVQITALWMCGRTPAQMIPGDKVTLAGWNPSAEVNPHLGRKHAHEKWSSVRGPGSSSRAAAEGMAA